MDRLGTFCLALALALSFYGVGASVWGLRRGKPLFVESARTTAYSVLAAVTAANGAMLAALLRNDFHLRYVAENSSRETPTFFKVLSLWSADDGSLLLWNLILAAFIAAVAFRFRRRRPETLPAAMAVLFGVQAFYLILVSGPSRPFATLAFTPSDGNGPLPLLQNHPLMAVHPPFLYLGFIGLTVPFAFAMASLASGKLSDDWIRITRRWALGAWCFLTVGLVLGALWSYGVLGWGGYWAWDPVENVALLPWLVTTAFLHSVVIEERRGMLKVWNLSLVVGAFALTTFGTFLTRGSILESVHTFARTAVGPMYLGFLVLVLGGGFGLIAARAWRFHSEGRLDSPLSREAAFLGNNLALLAVTLIVLVGTIFPLLVEAVSDRQVSVGGPYFRATTAPVLIVLLFLMGPGPLLSWRRTARDQVVARLAPPAAVAAAVAVGLAAAGMRNVAALAAFAMAAFVLVANAAALTRLVRSFARANGRGGAAAIPAALARNRRLAGGLVVHLGVAIAAIGITASSSFAKSTEFTAAPGGTRTFQGYTLTYEGMRTLTQPQRVVKVASIAVTRGGGDAGRLTPSLNLYHNSSEPIGTPSISYGVFRDLYSSLVGLEGRRATFRIFLNPGVTWLWVGGGVMALGGLFALWPGRRRVRPPPPVEHRRTLVEVGA
ncbi:MAG: heme lyase CcmF/NrfE family subunit [Actinomycetota bacterium]